MRSSVNGSDNTTGTGHESVGCKSVRYKGGTFIKGWTQGRGGTFIKGWTQGRYFHKRVDTGAVLS